MLQGTFILVPFKPTLHAFTTIPLKLSLINPSTLSRFIMLLPGKGNKIKNWTFKDSNFPEIKTEYAPGWSVINIHYWDLIWRVDKNFSSSSDNWAAFLNIKFQRPWNIFQMQYGIIDHCQWIISLQFHFPNPLVARKCFDVTQEQRLVSQKKFPFVNKGMFDWIGIKPPCQKRVEPEKYDFKKQFSVIPVKIMWQQ